MPGPTETPPFDFDPAFQTEKLGFDAGEMVGCDQCGRKNSPNRLACMYCGARLAVDPAAVDHLLPMVKKLDPRDLCFNLIPTGHTPVKGGRLQKAATILGLGADELGAILEATVVLPIARVEDTRSAEDLRATLEQLGIPSAVVADRDLDPDHAPRRLRRIEPEPDALVLTLFNSDEVLRIPAEDLVLIVDGLISVSRADQVEKKGLRGASKVIDETSSITYEQVVDIYTSEDHAGWRLQTTGFDFSALGEKKSLLAGDNLNLLTDRMVEISPNVVRISDYKTVRHLLGHVWEVETRQESVGFRRPGIGQKGFGSVTTATNMLQFTKFSRLQRSLYEA